MDRPAWKDGAEWDSAGERWWFGLWSPNATSARVVLFDPAQPSIPVVRRQMARDGEYFVAWVAAADAPAATLYGFQVDGPWNPTAGHRFDLSKVLLDPFVEEVWFPPDHDRGRATEPYRPNAGYGPLGVLPRHDRPEPPVTRHRARTSPHARVVYEVHVRGATMQAPFVPEDERGTFAGLRRLLPHLVELGVTTIELLPVHQADPAEGSYWGYMPLAFGAIHRDYVAGDDADREFREFVADAHGRGLEVMVDVVLNHTTEEDERGPTYSLRGVDNASYYVLDEGGHFRNDSGCGNIVRAGHPGVTRLLVWSLQRLADMGVDGFRFDLAAVLARDEAGRVDDDAYAVARISEWAHERNLHLVAEPWDMAAYLLGEAFPGPSWAQWNDRFRDDVRAFLRGEPGMVQALQQRVSGSPDIFDGEPRRSINFLTAHDGFTLYDLVSYDHKHNEANGHDNEDGSDANLSWNCGWEGDVGVPDEVMALRHRQLRNALTLVLLSNGTPMLLGGDEFGRTQRGNNNAYNQDNEISWFDWERADAFADLTRFVRLLVHFRRNHPSIGRALPWGADVTWYGANGELDSGSESRSLAWYLDGAAVDDDDLYVMANSWWETLRFTVHEPGPWWRVVDTSAPSPLDILEPGSEVLLEGDVVDVAPRSIVVLVRRRGSRPTSATT